MAIYAIDISFTNPDTMESLHRLYRSVNDFLNRFQNLDREYDTKRLAIADASMDIDEKMKQYEKLDQEFAQAKNREPGENSKYINCAVTTGRCHSWRRYASIKEFTDELTRNRPDA